MKNHKINEMNHLVSTQNYFLKNMNHQNGNYQAYFNLLLNWFIVTGLCIVLDSTKLPWFN